jgi:E3 ubiquitin-protein ligase ZNF598
MARASNLTGDSANAMAAIRSAVRSYRASEAPAKDLVNTFFNVLNQQLDPTGLLVNGLVDLFDDEDKRQGLLQAWNSFRVKVSLFA